MPVGSVKLRELDSISSQWPAPINLQHLQIVVELPPGKRCVRGVNEISLTRLDRPQPLFPFLQTDFIRLRYGFREARNKDEEHGLCWLKELHSKIWGRDDLIPTLIQRVEVTRAHYDQLQDILNQKYMGRDDAEYDGNHNVLSGKLGFLRSLPAAKPLSPPQPDDTEARDKDDDMDSSHDDDYEIDSFL